MRAILQVTMPNLRNSDKLWSFVFMLSRGRFDGVPRTLPTRELSLRVWRCDGSLNLPRWSRLPSEAVADWRLYCKRIPLEKHRAILATSRGRRRCSLRGWPIFSPDMLAFGCDVEIAVTLRISPGRWRYHLQHRPWAFMSYRGSNWRHGQRRRLLVSSPSWNRAVLH